MCVCVCVCVCVGGHYVQLDTGKVRNGEERGVIEGLRYRGSEEGRIKGGRKERQKKSDALWPFRGQGSDSAVTFFPPRQPAQCL